MAGQTRWEAYTERHSGIRFLFKTDPDAPDLLHIYARHLTTPTDAIQAFFDERAETTWVERHRRFETYTARSGLYWTWVVPDRVVRVISCFTLPD